MALDYNLDYDLDNKGGLLSGLINVQTKKEQRQLQVTNETQQQYTFAPVTTTTDSRQFTLTNAPTLILNSAGATATGSNVSTSPQQTTSPSIAPVFTLPTEFGAQSASQSAEQSSGLDLNKLALYGGIALAVVALFPIGKKVLSKTPVGKIANKVAGKK